jgi:hypothetical protein
MFAKLWMVGVQQVPHSSQNTWANIESYYGVLKYWFFFTQKALKGIGLIGSCGD